MRIWFDTEFLEDGVTIDLISIGAVREDGAEFYRETWSAMDLCRKSDWLMGNVAPYLVGGEAVRDRRQIAQELLDFAGERPEFWAYYADYDWVVLCQLYGRMMDKPASFPFYCRDLKQLADQHNVKLPAQEGVEHHALADARWNRSAHLWLESYLAQAATPTPDKEAP